jgi:hypothetical protein
MVVMHLTLVEKPVKVVRAKVLSTSLMQPFKNNNKSIGLVSVVFEKLARTAIEKRTLMQSPDEIPAVISVKVFSRHAIQVVRSVAF